jgi:hypothetical protein
VWKSWTQQQTDSVIERLSDPVPTTCLGHVSALHPLLYDLPLFFRGSIYAWFPVHQRLLIGGSDST